MTTRRSALLVMFVILLTSSVQAAAQTGDPTLTRTPAPSNTPQLDAFDTSPTRAFRSADGVLELQLPTDWQTPPARQPNSYNFTYGETGKELVSLQVIIGNSKTLYEDVLNVTVPVDSPRDALFQFKNGIPAMSSVRIGEVFTTKVGALNGYGLALSIRGSGPSGFPDSQAEVRIADLGGDQIVIVLMQGQSSIWINAQAIMEKMIESLVIYPQYLPTAQPTALPTATIPRSRPLPTARPTATTPGLLPLPTVPPGGLRLVPRQTVFHSSGVFSVPQIIGWNQSIDYPEETILPRGTSEFARFGMSFINADAASVIHAFVERDPDRHVGSKKVVSIQDLSAYYDQETLSQAWAQYTGGWKEIGRRLESNRVVIDFQLGVYGNPYRGRQISKISGDWLLVLRLVAPGNYPGLLDRLQSLVLPGFQLWSEALVAPLEWSALADSVAGYVIRYPPDWSKIDGELGKPLVIMGRISHDVITLTTRSLPGQAVRTEEKARAWLKATWPWATIQTVRPERRNAASGFTLSYIDIDEDDNPRSAIVTLLNGANGTLYVANIQTTARGLDLFDTNVPNVLATVRASFFVLPPDQLIKTPTPSPTASATPTAPLPTPLRRRAGLVQSMNLNPTLAPGDFANISLIY